MFDGSWNQFDFYYIIIRTYQLVKYKRDAKYYRF